MQKTPAKAEGDVALMGTARRCGMVPRGMGPDDKGHSSLAVLNVGWLDLFRFASKGPV